VTESDKPKRTRIKAMYVLQRQQDDGNWTNAREVESTSKGERAALKGVVIGELVEGNYRVIAVMPEFTIKAQTKVVAKITTPSGS
jgi:hypothetical protein